MNKTIIAIAIASVMAPVMAEEKTDLDTISITATREERPTKDVPSSIAVIDEERIDDSRMFNITDALSGTPGVQINTKNGGYDARMIIRGAGLKAPYGIREIMMLKDGVPLTDPDSFTRLDFVDTQDIERVEVTKGPGNIYAIGSAGGTIQIISKSVFDEENAFKVGAGSYNTKNLHLRAGASFGADESQAASVTVSSRTTDNDWRRWNKFSSDQVSVKYGNAMASDSTLEMELSYTRSDLQLPGSMDETQFEEFKVTGEQTDNNNAFKHTGRYSENIFFNTRLEKKIDSQLTFKPRFYANVWSHIHPVPGVINDADGVTILGTDLELSHQHQFLGDSSLVAGVTFKQDRNKDSKKYKYRDIVEVPGGKPGSTIIERTLSDAKGELMEVSSETNRVAGIFAQESMRPTDKWLIDAGFRVDRIFFEGDSNEIFAYDYATKNYVAGDGITSHKRDFTLYAATLGASYKLTDKVSVFATLAQGDQVPYSGELNKNPDLRASTSRNHEIGLKGRARYWQFDASVYYINTEDEVIKSLQSGETVYQNAGETDKNGMELSGSVQLLDAKSADQLWMGVNYAYSDYHYKSLTEVAYIPGVGNTSFDHSGNQLPYIPEHQYSLFMTYAHASGFKARLQADTWGEYYMDNANSEKYEGYDLITSLNLSYQTGAHTVSANVQNITDERYAVEVTKDIRGDKSYTAGTPRNFLVSYKYQF